MDARLDQLRHQRSHLPELAEIADLEASRKGVDDQARDARILVDDLTAEQAKVDADVEAVRTRRTRDRDRMDQGLVSNPKDLERMQRELESLERRIGSLEDDELEVMEKLEEAQRALAHLDEQLRAHDERLAALAAERDRRFTEIDAELATVEGGRGAKVEGVPTDLLALYDKLRASKGGVGAAELRARQCGGCRLTLDNAELAVIARTPVDQVVRCEECSRILVRTPESGL
ncbi:zinc ribbon domain-containing protein [Nocardioides oceani]|uniref:zinc ribbon domain-containing protein n=1 Tax=Nocardioides oceani TaxID=3058369 RepID=UPI003F6B3B63